jgi:hypothetical protein
MKNGGKIFELFTWRKIPYYIIFFFSMLLVGAFDLATYHFSLTRLVSPDFWANLGITATANLMVLFSQAKMRIDDLEINTPEVISTQYELQQAIVSNITPSFDLFIEEQNNERKKRKWKKVIGEKIDRLNRTRCDKHRQAWVDYVKNKNNPDYETDSKYVLKKLEFLKRQSDEWIDANITMLPVKVSLISYSLVVGGINKSEEQDDVYTQTDIGFMTSKLLPKFVLPMAILTLVLSLWFETKDFEWFALIPIVAKLLSLAMNAYNGHLYGGEHIKGYTLPKLEWRKKKILQFIKWKQDRGIKEELHDFQKLALNGSHKKE